MLENNPGRDQWGVGLLAGHVLSLEERTRFHLQQHTHTLNRETFQIHNRVNKNVKEIVTRRRGGTVLGTKKRLKVSS